MITNRAIITATMITTKSIALPSLEGLFNFCDYFGMSLGEFFEEKFNFPVEYGEIIAELNKMDTQEIGIVYEILKLINKNKK